MTIIGALLACVLQAMMLILNDKWLNDDSF